MGAAGEDAPPDVACAVDAGVLAVEGTGGRPGNAWPAAGADGFESGWLAFCVTAGFGALASGRSAAGLVVLAGAAGGGGGGGFTGLADVALAAACLLFAGVAMAADADFGAAAANGTAPAFASAGACGRFFSADGAAVDGGAAAVGPPWGARGNPGIGWLDGLGAPGSGGGPPDLAPEFGGASPPRRLAGISSFGRSLRR